MPGQRKSFWFGRGIGAALALLLLSLGCMAPEDPGPPYRALVYAYEIDRGYALEEVDLPTLRSLHGLDGEVTKIVGGAELRQEGTAEINNEEDLVAALRVVGGSPVDLRFHLRDSLIIPEDFGSLLLLSYYRNLELCHEVFQRSGLSPELPGKQMTFHMPTFGLGELRIRGIKAMKDNAAFGAPFGGFLLLPRQVLMGEKPFGMNLGVVCHEYSHAVFHSIAAGDSKAPVGMFDDWPVSVDNLIRSIDEGFADIFGSLVTLDSDYFGSSVPDYLDIDRDIAHITPISDEMKDALFEPSASYNPYYLGTVFASVFWSVLEVIGPQSLGESGVRAMHEISSELGPGFNLDSVSMAFFEAMEEQGRPRLCHSFARAGLHVPSECRQ